MPNWLLLAICVASAPFVLWWGLWLILAIGAIIPTRPRKKTGAASGRIDILIPAHDEQSLLPALLASLRRQTRPELIGTTLVVADHCSDATAAVARAGGAMVLERNTGPRGKPAAVRDGLAHLFGQSANSGAARRPVLLLDADCICSENLLEALAERMAAGQVVLQTAYTLGAGISVDSVAEGRGLQDSVTLGFALKNVLRPRGASRLGLPCQLMGTGMLFGPTVLPLLDFEDHLIEDVRMYHRLLAAGQRPTFVPEAQVISPVATDRASLTTQRLRWEGGQVKTWGPATRLALQLAGRGDWRSLVSLADSAAPPLAMTVLAYGVVMIAAIAAVTGGLLPPWALLVPATPGMLLAGYLFVGAWNLRGPRGLIALIFHAPGYLLWKVGLYGRMLVGRGAKTWQKTPRKVPLVAGEAPAPSRRVCLMGMNIDAVTERQTINTVLDALDHGRGGWIITPNLDHLRQFVTHPECRDLYTQASLVVPDGMPLIWASRLVGDPLPERVPGSGMIVSLSKSAAACGRSVFFLGGNPGAAEGAAARLQAMAPQLRVAGIYCPPMGFDKDPAQMEHVRQLLRQAQPDIVFVALSFPRQERVIAQLRASGDFARTWFMGVGISFSFLCGQVVRAPGWVQALGLEWLHRLVQEPRRLFRRYILQDLPFAVRLATHVARVRILGRAAASEPALAPETSHTPRRNPRGWGQETSDRPAATPEAQPRERAPEHGTTPAPARR